MKWFCGNGFVWTPNVVRLSSSAHAVIGDNATAALSAVSEPDFGSGDARTAGTSRVRKDGSITGIGSESIAGAACGLA
jgi:hypothetical protein